MAQINVTQFAKELGLPIELLIEQLQTAGVKKKLADDTVLTEKDKTQLLDYLRQAHGAREAKNKITLTRKQTTEIKKSDNTGKARTIQVEVRKKRVLVKREATTETPVVVPFVVMEPMVLLLMATGRVLAEPMPNAVPPLPPVMAEIEPVPVPLPMVLPVTVPMFACPVST